MTDQYILLWLEGPLQSWGTDSRYGRRDSLPFPGKSGVMGLVCAALGAGGAQTELLAAFADSDMQVQGFFLKGKKRRALLQDFHTIGNGYDENDPWQSLLIPKTQDGKRAVGGGAKLTYRYYLQDMAFAVLLQTPAAWLDKVANALKQPEWDLCLGRKCCVPVEFIFQGVFADPQAAQQKIDALANDKNRECRFTVQQTATPDSPGEVQMLTLNDVPLQFGKDKRYRDRLVAVSWHTTADNAAPVR